MIASIHAKYREMQLRHRDKILDVDAFHSSHSQVEHFLVVKKARYTKTLVHSLSKYMTLSYKIESIQLPRRIGVVRVLKHQSPKHIFSQHIE
jgi:hypothetical protein